MGTAIPIDVSFHEMSPSRMQVPINEKNSKSQKTCKANLLSVINLANCDIRVREPPELLHTL